MLLERVGVNRRKVVDEVQLRGLARLRRAAVAIGVCWLVAEKAEWDMVQIGGKVAR
jgi:hypothetical protein